LQFGDRFMKRLKLLGYVTKNLVRHAPLQFAHIVDGDWQIDSVV
jgi:hypothetical protein